MLQGHLIVWNNVPGGQNDYFEQKGPQTDIHWLQILPEYCTRPYLSLNMEIFIQKYIWPPKKLIFVKCPGRTKWESLSMWQFSDFRQVGYKNSSRVIGAITVAIVQLIECFNISTRLLLALKDSLLGSKIASYQGYWQCKILFLFRSSDRSSWR